MQPNLSHLLLLGSATNHPGQTTTDLWTNPELLSAPALPACPALGTAPLAWGLILTRRVVRAAHASTAQTTSWEDAGHDQDCKPMPQYSSHLAEKQKRARAACVSTEW